MADYLPGGGAELSAFAQNLHSKVSGAPTDYGLTALDMTKLEDAITEFDAAFADNAAKQIAAGSARILKDEKFEVLEAMIRALVRIIQANETTTNDMRGGLQINIPDTTATPAPVPDAMPSVFIDTVTPLRHEMMFSGEGIKGKPQGVRALEIWLKLGGDATGNPDDYQFQAQDTDSPYLKQFITADSGKQAHYLFCWVNPKGERGPWKMSSATVTSELQSGI